MDSIQKTASAGFRHALVLTGAALLLPVSSFAQTGSVVSVNRSGVPTFVNGELGAVAPLPNLIDPNSRALEANSYRLQVKNYLQDLVLDTFGATGHEDLVPGAVSVDSLGQVHVPFDQYINTRKVYGAELRVHTDAATGQVLVVNGDFVPSAGVALVPQIAESAAFKPMIAALGGRVLEVHTPDAELVYVLNAAGDARLAYRWVVSYEAGGVLYKDELFGDAVSGGLAARHPQIHHAKDWRTYDANNRTSLPGTLSCDGNQSCDDAVAQDAHNNMSDTWEYYNQRFGRDSLDDNGFQLRSTVHYDRNYNNAFWNGSQMVFGDGDGSVFSPLGASFDVMAHELTHGVTDFESDLIYQNESGALNEAFSDVFAAGAEAFR